MPRNGSDIYFIPPGTEGFPDTTIESEKYNNYIHDVETDLNRPRPISAGGTGANDADEALSNLGAEKSSQEVVNYDSHIFYPGSFYSKTSATAGPVDGHAFVGVAVSSDTLASPPANQNVILRAYDQSSAVVPGRIYVREKKAGVWGPWSQDSTGIVGPTPPVEPPDGLLWWDSVGGHLYVWYNDGSSKQWVIASPFADPALFLLKEGDTMEGTLGLFAPPTAPLHAANKQYVDDSIVNGINASNKVNRSGDTMTGELYVNANVYSSASFISGRLGNAGTYYLGSGANNKYLTFDGTYFTLNGGPVYQRGGFFNCTDGDISGGAFSTSRVGLRNEGLIYFGNTGGNYLHFNGSSYNFVGGGTTNFGGHITVNGNAVASGAFFSDSPYAGGAAFIARGSVDVGGGVQLCTALDANPSWNDIQIQAVHFPGVWAGWRFAGANGVSLDVHMSDQDGYVYSGNWWKPGGGFWADSSDARIKNVKQPYRSGLDKIAALSPVVYTFKGNDTRDAPTSDPALLKSKDERQKLAAPSVPYPNSQHYQDAKNGTQFVGLVAQECESIMPELVTKKKGMIDGVEVTDLRGLNSTPIVFALINACKELKARVEALEAKGG